jgi:hypothetical protein
MLAVAFLVGLSPLAADPIIHRGVDTFTTVASGTTFYDFSVSPIPAGFFCKSSRPFTDRVTFKGLPLVTGSPGQLHNADTVIERLDDAVFDSSGTAVTRIRFRALSLVSIEPIKTGCGAYHVYVTLAGPQRATTMRINRTEEKGGNFVAPLAIDARLTFIPIKPAQDKSARKLELVVNFTFPAKPIPWSVSGGVQTKRLDSALIDTNGDLTPDTVVFGTSNFWPGWTPNAPRTKIIGTKSCYQCEPPSCHEDSGETHCTGGVYACNGAYCP